MRTSFVVRALLALAATLLLFLVLAIGLLVTATAFDVWGQLRQAPTWFFYAYTTGFAVLGLGGFWLVWRLLMPRSRRGGKAPREMVAAPGREQVEQRLAEAEVEGADVAEARRELAALARRRETGRVYVALFGEISSGKSALIRALLPEAQGEVSVRGGTTRDIRSHHWRSPAGDELVLVDMPGTNEAAGTLDSLARAEALRAHVVIYVCEGDLTRSQFIQLGELRALGKPCILALNKTDRYRVEELEAVKERLRERLAGAHETPVVAIRAGGTQQVLRALPDGSEEVLTRELPPRVDELKAALQRYLDQDPRVLEGLRDSAVFVLVSQQLDRAEAQRRAASAEELVTKYSRRAVVGAMAAVTPGTDLLIQGYLGTRLVQELAALYKVPVRKMDVDLLLELVQKHVGRTTTLVLAIAGNALKAFPGTGTLAGGALHAVAYGMIFDTLGRAVAASLATRGALHPTQTAKAFKENLGEDLEASAGRFIRLALAQKTGTEA